MSLFDSMSDQDVMRVLWAIHPRCHWHRDEQGNFVWDDQNVPMLTDQQITDILDHLNEPHMTPRNRSYWPKDDQLDAIYKGFKYLRANGTDIGPDAGAWVDHIDAVKAQFPKQGE